MIPKAMKNGAYEEVPPKANVNGAWEEVPRIKQYIGGAWEETWSATKHFVLVGTSGSVSQSGNGASFTPNGRADVDFQLDKSFDTPTMSITYEGGAYVFDDETGTGSWNYAGDIKIIGIDEDGNEVQIKSVIVGTDTEYQDAKTSSFTFKEGIYTGIIIRLQSYGYGSHQDQIRFCDVTINGEIYSTLIN